MTHLNSFICLTEFLHYTRVLSANCKCEIANLWSPTSKPSNSPNANIGAKTNVGPHVQSIWCPHVGCLGGPWIGHHLKSFYNAIGAFSLLFYVFLLFSVIRYMGHGCHIYYCFGTSIKLWVGHHLHKGMIFYFNLMINWMNKLWEAQQLLFSFPI